ncbi:SDR family oxidoreductase [Nocardioides sp. LML1-1-1.1]
MREFLGKGATVVVADLPSARAKAEAQFGDAVRFLPVDVCIEEQVVHAVEVAVECGPLRVVASCAGIPDQHRLLGSRGTLDLSIARRVMEVNFLGTVSVLAHAAAAMQHNEPAPEERGLIVLVASIAGLDSASVAYGGSKAAVAGITLAAARELATRAVRVVTIAPGLFETAMTAEMSDGVRRDTELPVHLDRFGQPEEFAALVRHLADNTMINGETIRLDGAQRLMMPTGRS